MVNRRSLLFLGLAVVFGLAAALAARSYLAARSPAEIEMAHVVTAPRAYAAGTMLDADDLKAVEWPKDLVPDGALTSLDGLEGRVLRRAIAAGEPIFENSLLPAGSAGGLLGVIAADHRAVSVKVDAVVGIAGFVMPGARVDVLATLRRTNNNPFAKVILQDVRVLAVDDTLEDTNNGDAKVVNVVTLEVNPKQAEHLVLAAHEGRLQLALRKQGDEEIVRTHAVRAGDLYGGRTTAKGTGESIQLIRGNAVQNKAL